MTWTASLAGRMLGAARMSSAGFEHSTTAPADDAGVMVAAMSAAVPSTPPSPAASCYSSFIASSSVSAGPSRSVGAKAAKELLGAAEVGSSGVGYALQALPRLFFERAPERVAYCFSDGGSQFVVPTVVITMEPCLSRILVSK